MNNWFKYRQLPVVLLCLICSVPAIATARVNVSAAEENTVIVSYADLDLSKQAGVETLYGRLKTAARHACGGSGSQDFRNIGMWRLTRQCYSEALSGAVHSINDTRLTALYAR